MAETRKNHYVPEWYQKGFVQKKSDFLQYLDLTPPRNRLPDGTVVRIDNPRSWPVSRCFFEPDLYTTFFGSQINDEIERKLFGKIDDAGSRAIRAFIGTDLGLWHKHFNNFFEYVDTQKLRTPKGLQWIKNHYPQLSQLELMLEFQGIRKINCAIWMEGVREIVSAENSDVKFILSDHPVTSYNCAFPPEHQECNYPSDPYIDLKGTHTIFPLDLNHCLILTNYEYAQNPEFKTAIHRRTNPQNFRQSLVRTDKFIRIRSLDPQAVASINRIIKARARRYVAAAEKDWLYPENVVTDQWNKLGEVLLPPKSELWQFGGETIIGYKDGSSRYQDAFGRTAPELKQLNKVRNKNPQPNDFCGCGSGLKYKKCCIDKKQAERPSWDVLSIRERNLIFLNGIYGILGLSDGKSWKDVRKELSNAQVKDIHELYGFLWPLDTDIIGLLPKPDTRLRALYSGFIDPRLIRHSAIALLQYFDELIIQNPFPNPNLMNPKFSPVASPHQHKLQTLKNVMLMATLEPLIEAGYINFIPDPCSFSSHMQWQMFELARQRSGVVELDDRDHRIAELLAKDDVGRTLQMAAPNQQKQEIRKALPHLNDAQINRTIAFMEKQREEDPFALLQDDVLKGGVDGGQLIVMNMLPNLEMSLFLAQSTGALIVTDSNYRWKELTRAQHKENGLVNSPWRALTDAMEAVDYTVNANPKYVYILRTVGAAGQMRHLFREMHLAVRNVTGSDDIPGASVLLQKQFAVAYAKSVKEMTDLNWVKPAEVADAKLYSSKQKLKFLAPKGGIVHNNSQRILISAGSRTHLKNVPMAIFMELVELGY